MNRTLVIAEAGVNHNGDLSIAKQLIKAAKECGADIVKFQTARLESLVSASAPMADYQKNNTGEVRSQKDMLKRARQLIKQKTTIVGASPSAPPPRADLHEKISEPNPEPLTRKFKPRGKKIIEATS